MNYTIVIPRISSQINEDMIANTLWENNICKVSRILLVPSFTKDINIAYIGIDKWLPCSEYIVSSLKNNKKIYIGYNNWELVWSENFLEVDVNLKSPIKVTTYSEKYFENISQVLFMIAGIN
jgi:hypothetical protein